MKRMSNYMGLIPTLLTSAPAVAAEEGHAEAASGGLPQFDPTWWPSQIFWLALSFIFLYVFFSRVILPRLGGVMETRQAKIESDMQAAETLSAQADAIRQNYEMSLRQASEASLAAIKQVDDAAKEKLNTALASFRERFDAEIAATETRLQQSTMTAKAGMDQAVAQIAAQAAEKLAGIPADQTQAEHVVRTLSQKAKAA